MSVFSEPMSKNPSPVRFPYRREKATMQTNYEKLITKYSAAVFRCAYSYVKSRSDAEDIMQEVFLKYLTKKPVFNDETHEEAWFVRVTINMSKSYLRSIWFKKREALPEDVKEQTVPEADPELWQMVKALPEKYRIVVTLHFIEGYTIREIGMILKKNPSTVGTWLERGKKQLRKAMEERCDEK